MSERGSFVSQYFYCGECYSKARDALRGAGYEFDEFRGRTENRILAGLVYVYAQGNELTEVKVALDAVGFCHDAVFAVIDDSGNNVYRLDFRAARGGE
jgi:hypothetical protein